jgi:hypothetical protein
VPFLLLLNKADLEDDWSLEEAALEGLEESGCRVLRTSAKTGDRVEEAFHLLARDMVRTG